MMNDPQSVSLPGVLNLLCASAGKKSGGRKCVVRLLDTVFVLRMRNPALLSGTYNQERSVVT